MIRFPDVDTPDKVLLGLGPAGGDPAGGTASDARVSSTALQQRRDRAGAGSAA